MRRTSANTDPVLLNRNQRLRLPHPHHPPRPNDLRRLPTRLRPPLLRRLDLPQKLPDLLPRRKPLHLHRGLRHDSPNRSGENVGAVHGVLSEHGFYGEFPHCVEYE